MDQGTKNLSQGLLKTFQGANFAESKRELSH